MTQTPDKHEKERAEAYARAGDAYAKAAEACDQLRKQYERGDANAKAAAEGYAQAARENYGEASKAYKKAGEIYSNFM